MPGAGPTGLVVDDRKPPPRQFVDTVDPGAQPQPACPCLVPLLDCGDTERRPLPLEIEPALYQPRQPTTFQPPQPWRQIAAGTALMLLQALLGHRRQQLRAALPIEFQQGGRVADLPPEFLEHPMHQVAPRQVVQAEIGIFERLGVQAVMGKGPKRA